MTSLSLEEFLLFPAEHVRHLAAAIVHLLACPISDVAADHVAELQRISDGPFILFCNFFHPQIILTNRPDQSNRFK